MVAQEKTISARQGAPNVWRYATRLLIAAALLVIGVTAIFLLATFGEDGRQENWAAVSALGGSAAILMIAFASFGRAAEMRAEVANWRAVGDAVPYACVIVDARGRATYWNRPFEAILPNSVHAPLAVFKKKLGDSAAAIAEVDGLSASALIGEAASADIGLGDGGWMRVSVRPLFGRRKDVLWTLQEIATEHRLTRNLAATQTKLNDFLGAASLGFYVVDADGRFTYMNGALAGWLGLSHDEINARDMRLHDFVSGSLGQDQALHSALTDLDQAELEPTGGQQGQGETLLSHIDGTTFVAHISQLAWKDGDHGGVVRNLSPERDRDTQLALAKQQFRQFILDTPFATASIDRQGVLIAASQAWRMLAASRDNGEGGGEIERMLAGGESEKYRRWLAAILDGTSVPTPLQLRLAPAAELEDEKADGQEGGQGSDQGVTFFANPRPDEMGVGQENVNAGGLILQASRGGGELAASPQITQGQKMQAVGQLAGGIAHDFNNLLTAMIGFCDLLLMRHSPGDPSFSDIMQIKQNANRAANLVRQLLAFSRQQTLRPTVLDVTDVLADLANLLRRLIGTGIELELIHGRDLGAVRVDQGQLEQVIVNLAVNARDAMPNGGKLTVATRSIVLSEPLNKDDEIVGVGNYVSLNLSDTGIGMTREIQERIFEPFFTTKDVGAGTGLGMATVYGIIKQTGGHIFVDSELGEGTSFEILLPVGGARDDEAENVQELVADLTGVGTVLFVEDEDAVRLFGARALRGKGYQVIEAANGPDALVAMRDDRETIDLLITDVMMPEMDGPTLIRQARDLKPELPVICISGYAEDQARQGTGGSPKYQFLAQAVQSSRPGRQGEGNHERRGPLKGEQSANIGLVIRFLRPVRGGRSRRHHNTWYDRRLGNPHIMGRCLFSHENKKRTCS